MCNRKMLYGYFVKDGELAIEPKEAVVLKRIFNNYMDGLSYQAIADMLNEDEIPYSVENRHWNKNKIKRLLENPRYMGEKEYPMIITAEIFKQVQTVIQSKVQTGKLKQERPAVELVHKLYCAECEKKLRRLGCNRPKPGVIYLKCQKCGKLFNLLDETLLSEVERQRMMQKSSPVKAAQTNTRTVEITRIENELNRALEKLDDSDKVIRLIQQGIAARYIYCKKQTETKSLNVVRIDINKEEEITVHFE